jgi:hypothetical protein
MSFALNVDLTNPGQFFACCGLLELATRLGSARAHFAGHRFFVETSLTLGDLVQRFCDVRFVDVDPEDPYSTALLLPSPFNLRLDWWQDRRSGGQSLKVWAGTMESGGIARAMAEAIRGHATDSLFDWSEVVFNQGESEKKREPFYFDARRAPNSHSRDIGFSPNDLKLETMAFPAVEVLGLVGLQRFRPAALPGRLFEYRTWGEPITARIASVVVNGALDLPGTYRWQFENWFRTGQRKHKAFRPAILVVHGA